MVDPEVSTCPRRTQTLHIPYLPGVSFLGLSLGADGLRARQVVAPIP